MYLSDNESRTPRHSLPAQTSTKNELYVCKKAYKEVAPDGGWGWVICIATFMCHFVVGGTYYSYGIMLPHLIQQLNSDHVTISMIGSGKKKYNSKILRQWFMLYPMHIELLEMTIYNVF